jgi:antitoxin component YwqK of YwqJK toxin-antitoxin module
MARLAGRPLNFVSFCSQSAKQNMRSLLVLFLLANSLSLFAQTNAGFTLDELQLKRYDSKKKYPATVLRNEPDAYPDLVPVKIYQGKALYTGKIVDEKGSLKIEATVNEGAIVDFFSWDSEATRKQIFHVSTNGMYAWYATDSVYYDNQLFSTGMYYQNSEGNVMMLTRSYEYDNNVLEYSYRIGVKYGDEIEYDEPLQDGMVKSYHNGTLYYFETFRDGQIDGEVIQYDKNQKVLQRYYVNAMFGLYGTYYEYDTITGIVTVGHYTDRGIEAGQWISKYTDSSLAAIHWISETGNPDSSKGWDQKGNLTNVEYNYWRSSKTTGVNDYIHYNKSWYANGKVASYLNYNPGANDTISAMYDITGIQLYVERNLNGRIQTKWWHTNGQPKSERYGVGSGIAGVTLRDSVYREWLSDGKLVKERYYDKGKFIRSTDNNPNQLYTVASIGPAYHIAVAKKSVGCTWDTCSIAPMSLLDSISVVFDNAYVYSQTSKREAASCFLKVRDTQGPGSHIMPECKYNITLAQQESVKLDSSGKIVTKNIALNQFLDSLHLLGLGVAPLGHYEKKKGKSVSDFTVTTTEVRSYLNVFYINRRLEQLAPGSMISIYTQPTTKLAPEVIYIPQGEKTSFGPAPVTIIAVAGEGSTRDLKVGAKTIQWDARPFYVFHVYGDGEVEFARTTYKDTILLQYRGERTGVYDIQR